MAGKVRRATPRGKGGTASVSEKLQAPEGKVPASLPAGKTPPSARKKPPEQQTKAALMAEAKRLGIAGRSRMTKDDLAHAVREAQA